MSLFEKDLVLHDMIRDEADLFFYQGKPLLAAAAFLSVSDFRNAVQILVRNNELYLAYHISLQFYPEALSEVAILLAERAERFF